MDAAVRDAAERDLTGHFERRRVFRVDAAAWSHPEIEWASEDLIGFSAATARCDSLPQVVETSLGLLFSGDRVRSSAIITIDADGGIRRGQDDAYDPGLCARAVGLLWKARATSEALGDGDVLVEAWPAGEGVEAIACLPLMRSGVVRSLVAVWLSADSAGGILGDVSRLTLVGRLCSDARAWNSDASETGDVRGGPQAVELTTRQLLILRAMARGLTNAQIARQIRFSESTVRLESMCIYRHFAVHSRSEAVQAARALGKL